MFGELNRPISRPQSRFSRMLRCSYEAVIDAAVILLIARDRLELVGVEAKSSLARSGPGVRRIEFRLCAAGRAQKCVTRSSVVPNYTDNRAGHVAVKPVCARTILRAGIRCIELHKSAALCAIEAVVRNVRVPVESDGLRIINYAIH